MVRVFVFAAALFLSLPGLARAQELAGTWTGSIDWADGSRTPDTTFVFNSDGTFETGAYTGLWSQYENTVVWIISAGPRAVYQGAIDGDQVTAQVNNMRGMRGSARLQRQGGAPQSGGSTRK